MDTSGVEFGALQDLVDDVHLVTVAEVGQFDVHGQQELASHHSVVVGPTTVGSGVQLRRCEGGGGGGGSGDLDHRLPVVQLVVQHERTDAQAVHGVHVAPALAVTALDPWHVVGQPSDVVATVVDVRAVEILEVIE